MHRVANLATVHSFSFRCPSGPVRRVVPETLVEAMEYLQGHRQHANDEASQAVVNAQAAAAVAEAIGVVPTASCRL